MLTFMACLVFLPDCFPRKSGLQSLSTLLLSSRAFFLLLLLPSPPIYSFCPFLSLLLLCWKQRRPLPTNMHVPPSLPTAHAWGVLPAVAGAPFSGMAWDHTHAAEGHPHPSSSSSCPGSSHGHPGRGWTRQDMLSVGTDFHG